MSGQTPNGANWVPTLLALDPDLAPALARARIRDEASYQEREAGLPRRIRAEVAAARRDLLLFDRVPIGDLVLAAPPWVRDLPLAELGLPARASSRLDGAVRVGDLARPGAAPPPAAQRAIRLGLYRAVRRGAPSAPPRPRPPNDRVQTLVRDAGPALRALPLAELPGLPVRALNAARKGQIGAVGDLDGWTDANLKMLPYFGEKTLEDLLAALRVAIDATEPELDPVG